MKIAALMTCFNRKDKTLSCLEHLRAAAEHYQKADIDLWLNDDGSTDGTGEAVQECFNSDTHHSSLITHHLIMGSGHDYWCGGMRRAWQAAIDSGVDYDGYLWLNDDTMLLQDGLSSLLSSDRRESAILVGAIRSKEGRATFGGEDENGFVIPNGTWQHIRQMNGNVVWIPKAVYGKIGGMDKHWTHAMGDGDYSRTAVERGINVLLSPDFIGVCEKDAGIRPWRNPAVPFLKRVRNLYSPLGYSEPYNLFRYCYRHDGLCVAIKNYIACHMRVLLPGVFK